MLRPLQFLVALALLTMCTTSLFSAYWTGNTEKNHNQNPKAIQRCPNFHPVSCPKCHSCKVPSCPYRCRC